MTDDTRDRDALGGASQQTTGSGATNGSAPVNPFGGLSIDFSGDRTGGLPGIPMPEPTNLTSLGGLGGISFAPPVQAPAPASGGPSYGDSAPSRTETKLLIIGSGPA